MPDATVRGAVDTWAYSARASTVYGASRTLGLGTGTGWAFLYFTRPMPLGAVVTSAKLRLWYAAAWTGTTTLTAQRLATALVASRLNWSNKPGVTGATVTASAPAGPLGTLVELDVKPILQVVADGAVWHGIRIVSNTALRYVVSSEGSSLYRPELYVSWSEEPHAPTGLSPDGNLAVAVAKPVVRFQVTDTLGDTTINAVNVQVDDAPDFVGAWDSGWVTTGDPQLDLATTAYPGLADLQSVYWRVRVQDGAGLQGAWSDDAQMRRVNKSTVTITNPATGATPFVTEPTPPILWTFSGTQVAWQVLIIDPATGKSLADSGQRAGTETAWTVPSNVLLAAGPYRVAVRVWDAIARDPTDAFAEATRDFVKQDDPATTGVSALAVTQPNAWPGVELTWTRATAPDEYVIERDGVVIADSLTPGPLLVTGTTYKYVDPAAKCWQAHTWAVKAVVNGKQSQSATVTLTPTLRGIWLLDETRGLRVWLAGLDDGEWARPEDAAVLAPLGGTKVVRRVQGRRNFEGSLGGQLVDRYGRTAQQYEADLLALTADPTATVVLAVADFSLRVLLGNVQTAPTAHVPPSRLVTFDFWEV